MRDEMKGTASVLHQTQVYEDLVEEYSAPVADGLIAKAINSVLPNAGITSAHVAGFSLVTAALRTGMVDLQQTASRAQEDANRVTSNLLREIKKTNKKKSNVE